MRGKRHICRNGETMAKIFPSLTKTINTQIQESQNTPSTGNLKKSTSGTLQSNCSQPVTKSEKQPE